MDNNNNFIKLRFFPTPKYKTIVVNIYSFYLSFIKHAFLNKVFNLFLFLYIYYVMISCRVICHPVLPNVTKCIAPIKQYKVLAVLGKGKNVRYWINIL